MEVADKGSIRSAAESLAITQPALSRSIRAMEEELGVKLIERGPRGAELTPVGARLLKYSRIIDANLVLAEKELRGFRDHNSRIEQISFGMSWLTEVLIAGPLIERVLRNRAGIRLATSVGDYELLAPKLMSGRLDFFVGPPPMEGQVVGITTQLLREFPAVAVARRDHPLTTRTEVTIADLVGAQWILPAAGTVPRITYDNYFLRHGVAAPDAMFEVQPLSPVIRQLILESDLVTILPLVVVQGEISAGLLRVLPFDDQIVFPIHLTERQMRDPSPARDYVIGEVKALFAALADSEGARPAGRKPRARVLSRAAARSSRSPR
jgi:DNA-binding transcriptional LysR family regulator